MATIPQYPPALPFDGTEAIAIWQGGQQRQASLEQLLVLMLANMSGTQLQAFGAALIAGNALPGVLEA